MERKVRCFNESPKGFAGVVFIGRRPTAGGGPETVSEQAWATNQLKAMTAVKVADVPAEWLKAIGYDQPKPEPKPEPRRLSTPRRPAEIDVT